MIFEEPNNRIIVPPSPGQILGFGKYRNRTLEQLYFIDYHYLMWTQDKDNLLWMKNYMDNIPTIFPHKILIRCGDNHEHGCRQRVATVISVPCDWGTRENIASNEVKFWCEGCAVQHSRQGHTGTDVLVPLEFLSHAKMKQVLAKQRFTEVLWRAYGIEHLSKEAAWKLFWTDALGCPLDRSDTKKRPPADECSPWKMYRIEKLHPHKRRSR